MTLEQVLDTLSTLSAKTSVTHSDLDTLADCHDAIVQDLAAQMAVLITCNRILTLRAEYWKTLNDLRDAIKAHDDVASWGIGGPDDYDITKANIETISVRLNGLADALKAEGAEP